MSNLTLVTCLYNIGRGEMNTGFSRSFDHYKQCFSRLLKLKNFNMVIYCEEDLNDFIFSIRSHNNTKVINRSLDSLREFPFYSQVQSIRNDKSWINRAGWIAESTQAKLELYNPLVMSKQFMLNDASLFNFFNTKYFLWIDGGLANTVNLEAYLDDKFESRIIPNLNKMLYIAFPYDGDVEVHGFEKNKLNELAGANTKIVARGGVFGGNKDSINNINEIYYNLLSETLLSGYMGTEESIFTIIAYKHANLCNIKMIEGNGLVYKFFEDLKNTKMQKEPQFPLAFYVLTYNTPQQFKLFVDSFIKAYPEDFKNNKKYVIDNSTNEKYKQEYNKLFKEYDFEVIHQAGNIGINDGRVFAAKHFQNSDHKYYVFFEEDMCLVAPEDKQNKKGFIRYSKNIFENMIGIMHDNNLDFLRMTIIEFYGDNTYDWAFKNIPNDKKQKYFPQRADGDENLRWKSKVDYLGITWDGSLAYAVGHFHYSNWPIMFTKKGNAQMFLEVTFEHLYEQTLMSQAKTFMVEGKLKVGTLLAAPIEHNRVFFYDGNTRRENRHYTN